MSHTHRATCSSNSPVGSGEVNVDETMNTLEPLRHKNLWFDDGNIVLIAGQTAFRVHRSMLSRKSGMFRGLFTLPQPDASETLDGCPVVHLSDSSTEVIDFLDLLYSGLKYRKNGEYPTWRIVRTMLQLGTKYEVDELQEEALYQLGLLFPKNISGWDDIATGNMKCMSHTDSDFTSIVKVARSLDLTRIHACALYQCCQFSADKLLKSVYSTERGENEHDQLSIEDLKLCIDGRQALTTADCKLMNSLFESLPPCATPEGQCHAQPELIRDTFRSLGISGVSYNTLNCLDGWIHRLPGICDKCRSVFLERHTQGRQSVLDEIEQYFWPAS